MRPIYLDNNATTMLDARVLERMLPYFTECYGNAASVGHSYGREAKAAVEKARASVASCISAAKSREIVFTSGATESDNLAIKGVANALSSRGRHIITAPTEHKAVLDSCKALERDGFEVTYVPVDMCGLLDAERLEAAIRPDTILVSIMVANNEIGVLQDVKAIGAVCKRHGVAFHSDATQAVGKIPFDVSDLHVDLASFTAHKIYGPKGVGALYVRSSEGDTPLLPLIDGGGHEYGYRSGTLNVPGIVGLAAALELCMADQLAERGRLLALREKLRAVLTTELEGVYLNGHAEQRLPGHLSISFDGVVGEDLVFALPDIAVSTTSACSSGSAAPSYVLQAIGVPDALARGTLRIGIGRFNTDEDIQRAGARIVTAVNRARSAS